MARILGLDFDNHALYGAVVRSSFRKVEIERYVRVPLDPPPSDGSPDGRALRDAMDRLARAIGAPPNATAVAISGKHVSLRRVTLPKSAEKRASEILVFELESLLPFDADDAVIDHQTVDSDGTEVELMVAAALQQHVQHALTEMSSSGIEPRELCPAPLYLENLAQHLDQTSPTLILELREDETEVAQLQGGHCRMARTLGVTWGDTDHQVGTFLRTLQLALTGFRAAGQQAPERILITGPGADAPEISGIVSERLHLPVTTLAMPAPANGKSATPHFARALGLALRGSGPNKHINLRRGRFAHTQSGPQWANHANLLVTAVVAILVAVMFSLKAEQTMLLDEQAMLRDQLAATTKGVFGKSASTVGGAELLLKNPKGNDPLPRFDAFDALAIVSSAVDDDVKHEVKRLRIEVGNGKREGRLELQGNVASLEHRDAIAAQLEEHPCFSEIEQGKTTSARGTDGIKYQLEAQVHCPGDSGKATGRKARKKKP